MSFYLSLVVHRCYLGGYNDVLPYLDDQFNGIGGAIVDNDALNAKSMLFVALNLLI